MATSRRGPHAWGSVLDFPPWTEFKLRRTDGVEYTIGEAPFESVLELTRDYLQYFSSMEDYWRHVRLAHQSLRWLPLRAGLEFNFEAKE